MNAPIRPPLAFEDSPDTTEEGELQINLLSYLKFGEYLLLKIIILIYY